MASSQEDVHHARVLVVDDDPTVRGVIVDYFRASGIEVVEAEDGAQALAKVAKEPLDLVILDLMLPVIDGLEVFRRMRQSGNETSVIMLTARSSESERILGLEVGADDYLTKPFSPRELILRAQVILRRQQPREPHFEILEELHDGNLTLDLRAQKAFCDGEVLNLTTREFDLLSFFISNPDQVFSRDQLMEAVWGWSYGDPSTVTVHVRRLREKIEADVSHPQRLVTVWGRGYRWEKGEEA